MWGGVELRKTYLYESVFFALNNQSPVVVVSVSILSTFPSALTRIWVPITYGGVLSGAMSSVYVAHWVVSWRVRLCESLMALVSMPVEMVAGLRFSV